MRKMAMTWLPGGDIKLTGELGAALERSINNRLCKIDYVHLVDPFRYRDETDGAWRCEFWGKNVRAAILSYYSTQDAKLLPIIQATVEDMLSTQTTDGCISSYPPAKQLENWDIWGRKYVLLALIRYYLLIHRDRRIPTACARMLNHLMTQIRNSGKRLCEYGFHTGLAASSILGAVISVYAITREKTFLDFALEIINSGCSVKHNIFEELLNDTPPKELGNGKAYEMMSCFQGLAAIQQFVPKQQWLETVWRFYKAVRDQEIFITGAGGLKDTYGEYWYDGNQLQTETDVKLSGALGETCVTTTWLRYCNELMLLSADPGIPDSCERSLYNAVLGGVSIDCVNWVHQNPTPLAGAASKIPSDDQIGRGFGTPFEGHDCCRAQGPEALAIAPVMALMQTAEKNGALYLNLFESLETKFFRLDSDYPFKGSSAVITFSKDMERPFYLRTSPHLIGIKTSSGSIDFKHGVYQHLGDSFRKGQQIELEFDTSVRYEKRGELAAFTSGPLVLASDSRLDLGDRPLSFNELSFHAIPSQPGFRALFENASGYRLCDYASAGNLFQKDNTLQVWLAKK
jgi:DUF1680 family protein